MDSCLKCKVFIQDWFTQPLSPSHPLFEYIHPKRLERVLPKIAPIFIRFIKGLTHYDIHGIFLTIKGVLINATDEFLFEEDLDLILIRLSWNCMADHYIAKAPDEIVYIEEILKENFVCKNVEKELIGYYLSSMVSNLKEVHSCHTELSKLTLELL